MGGGGYTTTQSGTTSEIPGWSVPLFQKAGQMASNWMDSYGTGEKTSQATAADSVLTKVLDPNYLKVTADPTVNAVAARNSQVAAEQLAQNQNNLASGTAKAGTSLSAKAAVAQAEAARRSAADVAGQNSNLYLSELNKREGAQLGAVSTAYSQSQLPWQQALTALSLIRGTGGSYSSSGTMTPGFGLFNWL